MVLTYVKRLYDSLGVFIILLALVFILSILSPFFLTTQNLLNIIRQISFIAIVGIGVMGPIITTGIDLSSGSIIGLVSIVTATVSLQGTVPVPVAILLGLLIGMGCGALSGLVIAITKIPPFIMTLGMMTFARGLALLYSNGKPVSGLPDAFVVLGAGKLGPIPIPIIILLIVTLLTTLLYNRTKIGRHIYAIGGSEQAAIISGVNVTRIKVIVYSYAGLLSALSGIVLTARINSGQPGLGVSYELDAIAAAVIGGTSLSGGVGTPVGTIAGALIIGVINNGMDLLNVSAYWQQIAKGIIIVAAVLMDQFKNRQVD